MRPAERATASPVGIWTGGGKISAPPVERDITLVAGWSDIFSIPSHDITVDCGSHGDVKVWPESAKAWAVTRGVSDGTDPNGNVTREELVIMLYRYAGSLAMDVPELGLIGNYPDSADVSDWAQDAFAWAISKGFIDGRDGQLAPGAPVTRAEAATILARFHVLSK